MSLVFGQVSRRAVTLHQRVEPLATDRQVETRGKQERRVVVALVEIGFQQPRLVGLQGVLTGATTFEAVQVDAELLQINVGAVQHPDFRRAESVPVRDKEKREVSLATRNSDRGEESLDLFGRQKLDGVSLAGHRGTGRYNRFDPFATSRQPFCLRLEPRRAAKI